MRRLIDFPCAGDTLAGTLDEADGQTGLLIVSGGNEIRIGAHRGMALLAARLAATGIPVFRYDRRGIGDSTGENRGFLDSASDIAGAAATFSAETGVRRLVAFGNCDAATALALFHRVAGLDALILANPWTIEEADDLPPAAAIRARYAERLKNPREWLRMASGGVNIIKVAKGLSKISQVGSSVSNGLAARFATALKECDVPVTILLAKGDNTAIAFREAWRSEAFAPARAKVRFEEYDTASHSFARAQDKVWLYDHIRDAIARADKKRPD